MSFTLKFSLFLIVISTLVTPSNLAEKTNTCTTTFNVSSGSNWPPILSKKIIFALASILKFLKQFYHKQIFVSIMLILLAAKEHLLSLRKAISTLFMPQVIMINAPSMEYIRFLIAKKKCAFFGIQKHISN